MNNEEMSLFQACMEMGASFLDGELKLHPGLDTSNLRALVRLVKPHCVSLDLGTAELRDRHLETLSELVEVRSIDFCLAERLTDELFYNLRKFRKVEKVDFSNVSHRVLQKEQISLEAFGSLCRMATLELIKLPRRSFFPAREGEFVSDCEARFKGLVARLRAGLPGCLVPDN